MTVTDEHLNLVDPDLRDVVASVPTIDLDMETLDEFRKARVAAAPPIASLADPEIHREEIWVPGPIGAPDIRLVVSRPRVISGLLPLLLFIHGGGFVFGTPEGTGDSDVWLAREAGCVVASVDYRLSPETQAPGSVEDCYAALAHCHANATAMGLDPHRFAVGGISAGGGLAANLALMARDRGKMALRLQMLFCPILDDRTVTRDLAPHLGAFVWTPDTNTFGWQALTGGKAGGAELPPYIAASRADDVTGVAPAFIDVGALDLLSLESIAYAGRLIEAGVPSELHVHPGAFHGYELLRGSPVAERAQSLRVDALRRAFRHDRT